MIWAVFIVHLAFYYYLVNSSPLYASNQGSTVEREITQCDQLLDEKGAVAACVDLVGNNWNCGNIYLEQRQQLREMDYGEYPQQAAASMQHDRVTLSCGPTGALFCCPIWAMVRCLLQQVKVNCGRVVVEAQIDQQVETFAEFANEYRRRQFQPQIDQLHADACAEYPFASQRCENVLTYIQNNELLEPTARKYGLYRDFFSENVANNISSLIHFTDGSNRRNGDEESSDGGFLLLLGLIILGCLALAVLATKILRR